jgi:transcriptional regulator
MYMPKAFEVVDADEAGSLIDAIGVGHVVTYHHDGLMSSFIPLIFDRDRGVLRGHVARANSHHLAIGSEASALVIITGADGYISPSWYATKVVTGKVVPTWNYELVHVHGTARVVDDVEVESIVRALTDRHESTMAEPWSVDDGPRDYIDAMLKAIVGIEVTIERVEAKRKLSQNRSSEDVVGVIAGLRGGATTRSLADVMAEVADQTVIE